MKYGWLLLWMWMWLCWGGPAWAIGESCNQIWTQALRPLSPAPAWGYCFGTNPSCYHVSGATELTSLPASLTPGDYFLSGGVAANHRFSTSGSTVRIFVRGSLIIGENAELNWGGPAQNLLIVASGSVEIRANVKISGFILAGGSVSLGSSDNTALVGGLTSNGGISGGNNVSLTFDPTALSQLQGGIVCGRGLSCFNDNFQSNSLSDSWVVSRSSGGFTPGIVNGRLRLTENVGNQSTAASFQRLFPGSANLVQIEFDHFAYGSSSGEGADGMAIVFSDAAVTPQPGAFGGPLGYGIKPGIAGFAGGWLGIGLDEYGNYSAEGGPNSPGRRRQAVALRGSGSGSTGYRYLAGTCNNGASSTSGNCLSPTVDNNNGSVLHSYRLTVDSQVSTQALVKVERNTGSGFQTLINNVNVLNATGQAAVPANFVLSLTGSTGGANNIHELDNLQICALRSEPVGEQIDHFELAYSGQALTCKTETFTIKACKNAACTELYTGQVSATLTPATGWVGGSGLVGNTLNFSGGSASATLAQTTAATIRVGVSASTPATKPLSRTLCRIGTSLSAAHCDVVFADSGLLFSVPDKLAAKPVSDIVIKAVKKDGSQACVPSFTNVSRTVQFWSDYVSPVAPLASPLGRVTVSHGNSSSQIGTTSGSATAMTLNFNANGEASIAMNYPDAGQLNLNARYNGSVATNDHGLVLLGADAFVSKPVGLCIEADHYCSPASASCPGSWKAGSQFPLRLTARAWQVDNDSNFCDNGITPSFTQSNISLSHSLLQPSTGVPGQLTPNSYTQLGNASALTTLNASLTEVGVFALQASSNAPFLGVPLTLQSTMLNPLGRIVPDRFELSNSLITRGCGNFSYLSQPTGLSLQVQALNKTGQITKNYQGAFAKATATLVAEHNNNGLALTSRVSPQGNLLSWVNGEATYSTSAWTLARSPVTDGPFTALRLGLLLQDNDELDVQLASLDQHVATNNDCVAAGNCQSKVLGIVGNNLATSVQDWRYGRLQIVNALGSEHSQLPVQLKAEYWNSSQFVPNTLDSCSQVAPSRLLVSGTAPVPQVSGSTGTLQQGSSSALQLLLAAPGQPGRYPLRYQLTDYPWLQYDWEPANNELLENPSGEAVFGSFRGNNRQLFWREN